MKLSEAIRNGIKLAPKQAFGEYFADSHTACAWATAILGAGVSYNTACEIVEEEVSYEAMQRALYDRKIEIDLLGPLGLCPACESIEGYTYTVPHLNDAHHWTRERIAEWLEEQGL